MDDYARGGHSKHSLKVHLIFVTKYRKKLFFGNVAADLKQFIYEVCNRYGYKIIQMETDKDHIHILLEYKPDVTVSSIAMKLKQYSTNKMWQYHRALLRKKYWKQKVLWSDGYFACSIGQVSQEIIEKYIQNQG